jgi:hypothetical protein
MQGDGVKWRRKSGKKRQEWKEKRGEKRARRKRAAGELLLSAKGCQQR